GGSCRQIMNIIKDVDNWPGQILAQMFRDMCGEFDGWVVVDSRQVANARGVTFQQRQGALVQDRYVTLAGINRVADYGNFRLWLKLSGQRRFAVTGRRADECESMIDRLLQFF